MELFYYLYLYFMLHMHMYMYIYILQIISYHFYVQCVVQYVSCLLELILVLCSVLIGDVIANLLSTLSCSIALGYIRITVITIGRFVSTTIYDL